MAKVFGFEVDNRFNDLIKGINRVPNLHTEERKYFIKYLNEVKQGVHNNDFFEDELLERVILEVLSYEGYENGIHTPISYFETLISRAKTVFVEGTNTDGYDMLKELFINCIRSNYNLFSDKLFVLFDNKRDYADILNILSADKLLIKNANKIVEFGIEASDCGITQEELKRAIIAFANAIPNCDSIDTLMQERIDKINRRNGVYNISQKTLSLTEEKLNRTENILKKTANLDKIVENHLERMQSMSESAIKDIDSAREAAVVELNGHVDVVKNSTEKQVGELLKDVQADVKLKAAKEIRQASEEAKQTISDIRLQVASLSSTAEADYDRMEKAIGNAKKDFETLIKDEPKLKELLSKLNTSKTVVIKEGDDSANISEEDASDEKGKKKTTVAVQPVIGTPGLYIPGTERLILPVSPNLKLDDKIDRKILPAFDETIDFPKRFAAVKDKMFKMQKEDHVIFHEMAEELVRCVMEGDWPYIWGPSGSGKTYLAKQVANLVGLDVIDNGKITDKYSIMAYNDPHGRFRATPTFIALLYGKMLILDEFDNGNNDTQVVLNEIYSKLWETIKNPKEDNFVIFGEDMRVPVNPNFRMISIGNTSGEGGNELYKVRNGIDESVQERLTPKYCDYDYNLEQGIFAGLPAWSELFFKFRKVCIDYANIHKKGYAQGIVTTRDADAIVRYIKHNSKHLDQILNEKFIQVKDKEYLRYIYNGLIELYSKEEEKIIMNGDVDVAEKSELIKYDREDVAKKLVYMTKQIVDPKKRLESGAQKKRLGD